MITVSFYNTYNGAFVTSYKEQEDIRGKSDLFEYMKGHNRYLGPIKNGGAIFILPTTVSTNDALICTME